MRDVIQECLQIRRAYDSFSPGPTERSHLIGWGHNGSTGETPVGPTGKIPVLRIHSSY